VAPPAAIAANISIVSNDDKVLLVRRGSAVAVYPNQWNVGVNETMNCSPTFTEDFFGLVQRGLAEEIGLGPEHVATQTISWFGFCFDCGNHYVFAQLRIDLSSSEISDSIEQSPAAFEHSEHTWIPMTAQALGRIVEGGPAPDGSTNWLHHARLSAVELWKSLR
jgi:hypothetical protein